MVSVKVVLCVPLLLFCWCRVGHGGNVLVFPGEYSHWLNMRVMIEELVNRNHSVTVLVASSSPSIKYNRPEHFAFKVFQVPHSKEDSQAVLDDFINYWMYEYQNASMLQIGLKVREIMGRSIAMQTEQCDSMLKNEEFLNSLREMKFDIVVADPITMCCDLMADVLEVPLVISLRLTLGYSMERHCGHLPAPPSFVPSPPLPYTDHMSFFERVHNLIFMIFQSICFEIHTVFNMNGYYSEVKAPLCW
ncbi:UDP-glucuronosyltransferase 2B20-like [Aplochiton taeniatus]